MGIVVDQGKTWEKTYRKCINRVIVIATGDDICCCPYCGATLMDYETTAVSLHISLTCTQGRITEYLNATTNDEKERIKSLTIWIFLKETSANSIIGFASNVTGPVMLRTFPSRPKGLFVRNAQAKLVYGNTIALEIQRFGYEK